MLTCPACRKQYDAFNIDDGMPGQCLSCNTVYCPRCTGDLMTKTDHEEKFAKATEVVVVSKQEVGWKQTDKGLTLEHEPIRVFRRDSVQTETYLCDRCNGDEWYDTALEEFNVPEKSYVSSDLADWYHKFLLPLSFIRAQESGLDLSVNRSTLRTLEPRKTVNILGMPMKDDHGWQHRRALLKIMLKDGIIEDELIELERQDRGLTWEATIDLLLSWSDDYIQKYMETLRTTEDWTEASYEAYDFESWTPTVIDLAQEALIQSLEYHGSGEDWTIYDRKNWYSARWAVWQAYKALHLQPPESGNFTDDVVDSWNAWKKSYSTQINTPLIALPQDRFLNSKYLTPEQWCILAEDVYERRTGVHHAS